MANPQDPRKDPSPGSVNEQLQDRIIRHLLYLTRLSTQEANWIRGQIEQGLFPELTDRIAAGVNRLKQMGGETSLITQAQAMRLRELSGQLSTVTASFMATMQTNLFGRIVEIAREELDFELRLFRKTIPIEWNFSEPSENQLRSILRTQPFDGKPLDEWFGDMERGTTARLTQAIRQGMVEGESIDAIMRRIRGTRAQGFTDGVLNTTRRHAEALARSGVIHASNQATNEFYRANDDLIKGIKVVVTLDSRTCATCMGYDEDNPYDLESHPTPPFHVNCRCTTVAITKSWRELGIDLDEAPEGTQASMNGQVPESLTYNQWLRRQPKEVVEEALGPTRAKLFREGNLSVTSFTDRRGRILNLEQIRRLEGDAFEELGIGLN